MKQPGMNPDAERPEGKREKKMNPKVLIEGGDRGVWSRGRAERGWWAETHHALLGCHLLDPQLLGDLWSDTLSSLSPPLSLLPTPGKQMQDGGQVGSSWSTVFASLERKSPDTAFGVACYRDREGETCLPTIMMKLCGLRQATALLCALVS